MSYNNSNRFSREGFQKLGQTNSDQSMAAHGMGNPNDVTIDIPLTKVTTSRSTGARKITSNPLVNSNLPEYADVLDEKQNAFGRAGVAGRRKKLEQQAKGNTSSEDGSLTAMGKFYSKIYHFSVVTRYLLYVAPLALAIAVPIIIGATVAPNARIGGTRIVWFFAWVEIVWCSIWVAKLMARFLPYFFQFVVGVVSAGTRKYALIIAALEHELSLVGWTVTSLATFRPMMTKTPGRDPTATSQDWLNIVQRILFACLFSSLVLLAEKVLIQLISISYHRKQFDAKIKDSKRNIYLVTVLYEASRAMFPTYCDEFAEEDYIISDTLGLDGLGSRNPKGHKKSGSATPMRLLQNVRRVGDKVAGAFGDVAHEITGKQLFNPGAAHSIVVQALEKKRSSEALARRLWLSFVLEGNDALHLDDVIEVFGSDKEDDAREIFACLDVDGNGDISLDEMVLRISEFGRERAALANSMRDVDQAIRVLDNLLMTVVSLVCVFIFVAWLNSNFTTTLATAGTALLSLSFVFSVTAQELLGSCIFLFVKHPFDVGDRVDINNEQLVVERISLLYTMFRKVKDHKCTQVPNIVLNSLWVENVSRSKAMRERLSVFISFDTTFEDIELLRKEMQAFVLENGRDFQSEVEIECLGLGNMDKMELLIEIRHKSNWAIESIRAARRSKFMCALVLALRKVPIYAPGGGGAAAGDKANPTYSVSISDSEAQQNKDQYAKDKEAKRLVPSAPAEEAAASTSVDFFGSSNVEARERAQAENMNERHVMIDPSRRGTNDEQQLDRQRTQDLEEVRTIMRRESTRGRRKAHQSPVVTSPTGGFDRTTSGVGGLETLPEPAAGSDYYDDGPEVVARPGAPTIHVSRPSQSSSQAPLQATRFRSDSNSNQPTTYETPGNAFSQQSPPRRPVPGINEMRSHLQNQPQSGAGPSR